MCIIYWIRTATSSFAIFQELYLGSLRRGRTEVDKRKRLEMTNLWSNRLQANHVLKLLPWRIALQCEMSWIWIKTSKIFKLNHYCRHYCEVEDSGFRWNHWWLARGYRMVAGHYVGDYLNKCDIKLFRSVVMSRKVTVSHETEDWVSGDQRLDQALSSLPSIKNNFRRSASCEKSKTLRRTLDNWP